MDSGISRRAAASYAAGIGLAAWAGVLRKEQDERPGPRRGPAPGGPGAPGARAAPRRPLPRPRVRASAGGELAVTLTARPAIADLGAARLVRTLSYGGTIPGDTWEVRGGDTLRVRLRNRLPPARPAAGGPLAAWTDTNLHGHGLHVSPAGRADNMFLAVPPGEEHRTEIAIPRDHPGGLFWYHPQCHGGVAQQLRAGMAGALVVRGRIDEVAEVRAAAERIMVLQAIELDAAYRLPDPVPEPGPGQAVFPRDLVLYPVNGAVRPTLAMYPGEVQRWRLVNASAGTFMSLRLAGHEFHVLAWDGLTLAAPEPAAVLMLCPGSRAEVLVRARRAGAHELTLTPGSGQQPGIPGMPAAGRPPPGAQPALPGFPVRPGELTPHGILTVQVSGSGPAMGLPSALPAWDPPRLPVARRREFAWTTRLRPGAALPGFGVDGAAFDPARPPSRPVLGTAEEWTIRNAPGPGVPGHAHVLHVHTNPFRVTRRNGARLGRPQWRDTCVLTAGPGDSVTVESAFTDYAGRLAEHSGLAAEQDLGMMSAVEIIPADEASER